MTSDSPKDDNTADAMAKRDAARADARFIAALTNVVAAADARADVVPARGLTPTTVHQFDAARGQPVDWVFRPGEVLHDVDGTPNGIGPPHLVNAPVPRLLLTTEQRIALGPLEPDTGSGDQP